MKAEEILMQSKYTGLKNLVLICEAMDEFASELTKELEKENSILKELNGGKLLAYDQMKEMLEQYAIQKSELEAREADWLIRCSKVEAENARLREALESVDDLRTVLTTMEGVIEAGGSLVLKLAWNDLSDFITKAESALSSVEENKK